MSRYEIRRYDTAGNMLEIINDFKSLSYVRSENKVGVMELIVPSRRYSYENYSPNQILEIWRQKGDSMTLQNETAYFLRDWVVSSDGLITLYAHDANWLLSTRIVAYDAGSAQAEMTDYADDMMKAIVKDNLGADADSDRQLSTLSIAGDLSASESLTKAFSRQNVLAVCQDLCEAAAQAGTNTYFDVVRTRVNRFQFRTYTGQRGQDHSRDSEDVRLVGEQYGNFVDVQFGTYHGDEINYVYAGGQGEEEQREIVEVSVDGRIAKGAPYNRCEGWVDARNAKTTTALTVEARIGIREGKPKQVMTGRLIDTPGMQFNVHYGFGDLLTAEGFDYSVDCHVSNVRVVVSENEEQIDARLQGEL